jgi:hypothetical protein
MAFFFFFFFFQISLVFFPLLETYVFHTQATSVVD